MRELQKTELPLVDFTAKPFTGHLTCSPELIISARD